jgi:hypothetical protein
MKGNEELGVEGKLGTRDGRKAKELGVEGKLRNFGRREFREP